MRNTAGLYVAPTQGLRGNRRIRCDTAGAQLASDVRMSAETTRLLLLPQHERPRGTVARCGRRARGFRRDGGAGDELDLALEQLRDEFDSHNEAEGAAIRLLLHGPAAWGSLMIDRMLEEHLAEHAAFCDMLAGTLSEVAARIDDLAEELEAHMAAEERTFLAPVTLRDDVLRIRTRESAEE